MSTLRLLAVEAHLLDLLTFSIAAARFGVADEANPFMRSLFHAYGLGGPATAKVALLALALLIASRMRHRVEVGYLGFLAVAGLIGFGANVLYLAR